MILKKYLKKANHKLPKILSIPLLGIWSLKKYIKIFKFIHDVFIFKKLAQKINTRFLPRIVDFYPILGEDTEDTGFDRHYIYHPAWAARVIALNKPEFHVDISSIINFSTQLSAFIPVRFYDYRPANISLSNLQTGQADLLALPFHENEIKSLSCMHVVEHIGLGRYGDPLDPEGDIKAINELKRVLAYGGDLLFVVPIGVPKLAFNAHRVYSYDQILSYFKELKLIEFVLIPRKEDGGMLVNPEKEIIDNQDYGCGCFWFRK